MSGMKNNLVGLDTNIFIYQFQGNPQFVNDTRIIFSQLAANKIKAITSVITFTEVLAIKESEQIVSNLKQLLLEVPNMQIIDVSQEIAEEAAMLRRKYNFRLPDAIQLATALCAKADLFITNDTKLKGIKEIKSISLHKFTKM